MAHIVLAHGFLGAGENPWLMGVDYFNGVAAMLRGRKHEVLETSVSPLGSLDERSQQLAREINERWPGDFDLYVIAHSMGGLDARRVIARHEVGRRIKKLITIATPHFGTPVANAVLDRVPAKIYECIPGPLLEYFNKDGGALNDLRVRQSLHDPNCPWVDYMEVACVAPRSRLGSVLADFPIGSLLPEHLAGSLLFGLTRALGDLSESSKSNDGLVTLESARCPPREPIEEWLVDHGGAIGWPSNLFGVSTVRAVFSPSADHLARYRALAERLEQP
ncbi:esterase/lipase family protein [Azohydromonas caseinilytica]|uniref:GPI inositol-deacylase PGAP1-like alpha/beta domain-containing protein n=1 Tax=Azohydromonas caseinilytica TaxID=2728836 RepID=A0A848FBI1_9BURK|nr:hypothetical protein [Azohydromonas caseinilytica]NML15550.1 hypothetical protein [Azohydromonas caseinilytica]